MLLPGWGGSGEHSSAGNCDFEVYVRKGTGGGVPTYGAGQVTWLGGKTHTVLNCNIDTFMPLEKCRTILRKILYSFALDTK